MKKIMYKVLLILSLGQATGICGNPISDIPLETLMRDFGNILYRRPPVDYADLARCSRATQVEAMALFLGYEIVELKKQVLLTQWVCSAIVGLAVGGAVGFGLYPLQEKAKWVKEKVTKLFGRKQGAKS